MTDFTCQPYSTDNTSLTEATENRFKIKYRQLSLRPNIFSRLPQDYRFYEVVILCHSTWRRVGDARQWPVVRRGGRIFSLHHAIKVTSYT